LPDGGHRDADLLAIGRALKTAREQQSMSIEALAHVTGVSGSRIRTLEAGLLDPTYELLLVLSDGLGMEPSTLVAMAQQRRSSSG